MNSESDLNKYDLAQIRLEMEYATGRASPDDYITMAQWYALGLDDKDLANFKKWQEKKKAPKQWWQFWR